VCRDRSIADGECRGYPYAAVNRRVPSVGTIQGGRTAASAVAFAITGTVTPSAR